MTKPPYIWGEIEQKLGRPLDRLIPDLLDQMGSQKAVADHLGISQASLSRWLKENGYQAKVVWEKVNDAA